MATKLIELTNTNPDFYPTLGPYLANRDVHKFVGDTIWDDNNKTWLISQDVNGVCGFCAVSYHRRHWTVESLYLSNPEDHRTGTKLIAEAVKRYGLESHLHATVRHQNTYAYTKAGFATVGETRNFTKLVRPATITKDNPDA